MNCSRRCERLSLNELGVPMNWVLILLVVANGNAPAMTTATFNTEAGCRNAAEAAEFAFEQNVDIFKYVCVPNNSVPS